MDMVRIGMKLYFMRALILKYALAFTLCYGTKRVPTQVSRHVSRAIHANLVTGSMGPFTPRKEHGTHTTQC